MTALHRILWSLSIFGIVSLSAGCIPILHTENKPRGKLRFIDEQSGAEVHQILVLVEFEDFFGYGSPTGPGGEPHPLQGFKSHYFASAQVWNAQQELHGHWAVAMIASPFWFLPAFYGGWSQMSGLLVVTPGYRTTYVPSHAVYPPFKGQKDSTITMARAASPESELARFQKWLQARAVKTKDLAACRIIEGENYKFPLPPEGAYGFRFTPGEWKIIRQFLDASTNSAATPPSAPVPQPQGLIGARIAATLFNPSPKRG